MRIDKDRPVDGNCLRLKRLILGDTDDAYFAHQHTGIFVTSCHCKYLLDAREGITKLQS